MNFKEHYTVLTEGSLEDRVKYMVKTFGKKWNKMWQDRWENTTKPPQLSGNLPPLPDVPGGPRDSLKNQFKDLFSQMYNYDLQQIKGAMDVVWGRYVEPNSEELLTEEFTQIAKWDPTPNYKYLQWIIGVGIPTWLETARTYHLPTSRLDWDDWEDGPQLRNVLERFHIYSTEKDHKDNWKKIAEMAIIQGRLNWKINETDILAGRISDISKFKTWNELNGIINHYEKEFNINPNYFEGTLEDLEELGSEVVARKGDVAAVRLDEWEANKAMCNQMGWCVTNAESTFRGYAEGGLYVFVEKLSNTGRVEWSTERWKAIALYNVQREELRKRGNERLTPDISNKIKDVFFDIDDTYNAEGKYEPERTDKLVEGFQWFIENYTGDIKKQLKILDMSTHQWLGLFNQPTGTNVTINNVIRMLQREASNPDKILRAIVWMYVHNFRDPLAGHRINPNDALEITQYFHDVSTALYSQEGYEFTDQIYEDAANLMVTSYRFLLHTDSIANYLTTQGDGVHEADRQRLAQMFFQPLSRMFNVAQHRSISDLGEFFSHIYESEKVTLSQLIEQHKNLPREWADNMTDFVEYELQKTHPDIAKALFRFGDNLTADNQVFGRSLFWMWVGSKIDWSVTAAALKDDKQFREQIFNTVLGPSADDHHNFMKTKIRTDITIQDLRNKYKHTYR